MRILIPNHLTLSLSHEEVGSKAERLMNAAKGQEHLVPEFWLLPGSACVKIIKSSDRFEEIKKDLKSKKLDKEAKDKFRKYIQNLPIPNSLVSDLEDLMEPQSYFTIRTSPELGVRSSKKASFCNSNIEKIKSEILSHIAETILEHGLPFTGSILIQKLLDCDKSVVVYTADPKTGDRSKAIIKVYYGIKEFEGQIEKIEYHWRDKKVINYEEAMKTKAAFRDANGEEVIQNIENKKQLTKILDDRDIKFITETSYSILEKFSKPLRIHYSITNRQISLLGIKIPRYFPAMRGQNRKDTTWSNENLETSYLGLTSPLTFSINRHLFQSKLVNLLSKFNLDSLTINTVRAKMQHILSLITCRIFINKSALEELVRILPEKADQELLQGFLINNKSEYSDQKSSSRFQSLLKKDPSFKEHAQAILEEIDFENRYKIQIKSYNPQYFATHNIGELFEEFEFLLSHYTSIHEALGRAKIEAFRKREEIVANGHTVHAQASGLSIELASTLDTPTYYSDFLSFTQELNDYLSDKHLSFDDQSTFITKLEDESENLFEKYSNYILNHGYLSFEEGKFHGVTVAEDPSILLPIISLYCLDKPINTKNDNSSIPNELNQLFLKMRKTMGHRKLKQIKNNYSQFQSLLIDAEHLRTQKLKFFMMIKQLIDAIGLQLYDSHFIEVPSDIHFFLIEEFEAMELGGFLDRDIKDLIQRRKQDYNRYTTSSYNLREFKISEFMPVTENVVEKLYSDVPKPWGQLHGMGNDHGVITGEVKVLRNLNDLKDLHGKIVVTQTSSSLLSLIVPFVKGIIIEQCSHSTSTSSIVNAYRVPMISNIPHAISRMQEGQTIHLDSKLGVVEKLADESVA